MKKSASSPMTHQVESLAGIMGGDATAVSDDTQNIYIEAAFWWPEPLQAARAASTSAPMPATALSVAWIPSLTVEHIERITQLVIDICGTPEPRGPD
jgi:phenylalanyl-tRNA synthetase beta chain